MGIYILTGSILGFFIVGYFFKSNYTTVLSKKSFDKSLLDDEILSDFCSTNENGKTISGILILTNNKRLFFMPLDAEKSLFDFDFLEQKNVTLQKQFGLPNGLIVNENINLSVSYPLLWLKEIYAA